MLTIKPLFSSSKGNCTYVETENTSLLVDVGISCKRAMNSFTENNINPQTIEAILITHEHSDHISGVRVLSNKLHIPVFATSKTWDILSSKISIAPDCIKTFNPNESFNIGDIEITPFNIPHDAIEPCGFSFTSNNSKVTLATDLGHVDNYLLTHMLKSDTILLESNHDISMLQAGPYPWELKQRIIGDRGHLSNLTSAKIVEYLIKNGTKNFILGHLSEQNNIPELALTTILSLLKTNNINLDNINISVAKP